MSVFEYIAAIFSIVLGLALANLLSTLVESVKHRESITLFWVHSAWCLIQVLSAVGSWWFLWRILNPIEVVSAPVFWLALLHVSFHYAISRFLRPEEIRSLNLEEYFFQIKTPMFVCLLGTFVVGDALAYTITSLNETWAPFYDAPIMETLAHSALPVLAIVGVFARGRRTHQIVAIAWITIYIFEEIIQSAIQ